MKLMRIVADAPGSVEGQMALGVAISRCGDVHDGVSMAMVDDGVEGGGWVIAFADLERWYLENKRLRSASP